MTHDPEHSEQAGNSRPAQLPPDPAKYDSPRAAAARARGLDAPYIPGGEDPQPERARREERFYGRILGFSPADEIEPLDIRFLGD